MATVSIVRRRLPRTHCKLHGCIPGGSMRTATEQQAMTQGAKPVSNSGIPEDIPPPRNDSNSSVDRDHSETPVCTCLSGSTNHGPFRRYAMKTIFTNRVDKNLINEIHNEINILRNLDHPNIIQLLEVYEYRKRIYMLMELCEGGSLQIRGYTEPQVCHIIAQVLRALVYLHDQNIMHRDLKMENIVVENIEEEFPTIKLIDFGLSQVFTSSEKIRAVCGTVYTIAPEVISGEGYTAMADMWSAGVITFLMLSGEFPFLTNELELQDPLQKERLKKGKFYFTSPIWQRVSKEAKTFISNLLRRKMTNRWTARQALGYLTDVWEPRILRDSFTELTPSAESRLKLMIGGSEDKDALEDLEPFRRHRERLPSDIIQSMQRFSGYGELKKAALMMTAFYLDKSGLQDLRKAFEIVDYESNGVITLHELREVLSEHQGIDEQEIARVFGNLDMDRTGKIHYLEFLAASLEARGYVEEERLVDAFERLDMDHKGRVHKKDLKKILGTQYTEELANKMIKEADYKGYGYIDFEEFMDLMRPTIHKELREEFEALEASRSNSKRPTSGSIELYNELALAVQRTLPRGQPSHRASLHDDTFVNPSDEPEERAVSPNRIQIDLSYRPPTPSDVTVEDEESDDHDPFSQELAESKDRPEKILGDDELKFAEQNGKI